MSDLQNEQPVSVDTVPAVEAAVENDEINVHVSPTWSTEPLKNPNHDPLTIPSIEQGEYNRALEKITEGEVRVSSPDSIEAWVATAKDQHIMSPNPAQMGSQFLNVPKARYTNHPTHKNRDLVALRMRSRRAEPGDAPTTEAGAKAVLDLLAVRGLGTRTSQFLPHSGIHLNFQPPDDPSLMELYRQMVHDTAKLGRDTYGLYLSMQTAYQAETLVNFALAHVVGCSVSESVVGSNRAGARFAGLRNLIDYRDIPFLLQGLALAAYPRGINYRRACSKDAAVCDHIMEGCLSVSELAVVNLELFTEEQLDLWANPRHRDQTEEDLKRYRDQFPKHVRQHILRVGDDVENEVEIEFGWASIQDYLTISKNTVDKLVSSVEKAIAENSTPKEREQAYMTREVSIMGATYAHIVKAIRYNAGTVEIVDRETITEAIKGLTADQELYDQFIEAALTFVDRSRVGILAVPAYKCPKCGADHSVTSDKALFREYLPLDPIALFFDLLYVRHNYLMNRTMINVPA